LRAVAQTQAAQYVGDVVFDGSLADHQMFGNLAIRRAFGDQAKRHRKEKKKGNEKKKKKGKK